MSAATLAAPVAPPRTPLVAVVGNPNTGKTVLFNRLTKSHLKVANYPGVTVERQSGPLRLPSGRSVEVLDVPGAYSLSARSREEEIAIEAIAGLDGVATPDLVVFVADATQLSRNLYMVLQVLELEVPLVLALNMMDVIEKRRETVGAAALERELGVPVVPISALKGTGLDDLERAIDRALADPARATPGARWTPDSGALRDDIAHVERAVPAAWSRGNAARARALAVWAMLSVDEADELVVDPALRAAVLERRVGADRAGRSADREVIFGRYGWIDARMPEFHQAAAPRTGISERVDALLLSPWLGFPVFLATMAVIFLALFSWSEPAIRAIENAFTWGSSLVRGGMPAGIVRDFITEGLIAGVGSVIVFLPQILLLFFFIGILESSGYMSRVACLMDRLMRMLGLNGRAFVPMLSGYACAIPAILATRTMERQRDRTLTMMVVPLMSCSARLPVYTLIIGALFPSTRWLGLAPIQSLMLVAMYLFSTLLALVVAAVMSRTLLPGRSMSLIMELPPYRMPHWPSVWRQMVQRARVFLTGAGTVILACTIALWILLSFPRDGQRDARRQEIAMELATPALANAQAPAARAHRDALAAEDASLAGDALRTSWGGKLGHAIEPAIAPLGFDWKIGIGLIGAFAAREVFVATMGVVYGIGDASETSTTLRERIRHETRASGVPVYTPLVGLSLMVFFALACQCMSTLATVKRESHSWGWALFLFTYMGVLAWVASFCVYQGGRLLGL